SQDARPGDRARGARLHGGSTTDPQARAAPHGASLAHSGARGGASGAQAPRNVRSPSQDGVVTMILTVTLNAAIDRTPAVPTFHVGRRHRAAEQPAVAGGKGVTVPRGVPVELYGQLVEELHRLGVKSVLDTEGEPLRVGTRSGPDLVTPNVTEAEELVGHEFADDEDKLNGVREIVELGARDAVIT